MAATVMAGRRAPVLRLERFMTGDVFGLVMTDDVGEVTIVQQVLYVFKDLHPTRH